MMAPSVAVTGTLAQLYFLGTKLRGEIRAEILGLEHPPDLDLLVPLLEGGAADPLDRFLDGLHLPEPEARDELLGLRERAVGEGAAAAAPTPALTSSSLNLPISVRISLLGRTPASDCSLAFTITMTRMWVSSSSVTLMEVRRLRPRGIDTAAETFFTAAPSA